MNRIMGTAPLKYLPAIGAAIFAVATLGVCAETADPMAQRNQALQQQYSRVNEILVFRNNPTTAASSRMSSRQPAANATVQRGNALVHTNSVSFGVIQLSKDATVNQQLNEGMNNARSGLESIKTLQQGSDAQKQQRDLALAALDQTVQAYLDCRAENRVPINAHYEQDPFLKQMIVIRQKLVKEK